MSKLKALVELARPGHWIKNLLVFAALIFSGRYGSGWNWLLAAGAFAQFCLLSSGAYAWNDIFDRKADGATPGSCRRPIPSGRLTVTQAASQGTCLLIAGMLAGACLGWRSAFMGGVYLVMTAAYNVFFRRRPIADVVLIALGFVVRAIAGGVAIGVTVSAWLVVCTFMLCVFLGLIKRRAEIVVLGEQSAKLARPVHAFYTLTSLDHMLGVSAGLAIVTYTSYCVVGLHSPSVHMVWTIPIVLYGMFRLYSLAVGSSPAGPVELIRRDKVMWLVALTWVLVVVLVMRIKDLPFMTGWLTP